MPTNEETNLTAKLEQALVDALRTKQCEQWLAENSEAFNAYNEHVKAHGVFSDNIRSW
jgi:antitoxin CcdA